jgi:hypothetical protein
MTTSSRILISAALLSLNACAPLQQAPLVYSSKVAVGIDVSATSTETPGVGISVGYKQVDAAYVPVAVARKCEVPTEANCLNEKYAILPLNGHYDNSNSDQQTPSQVASASAAADKAAQDLSRAQARLVEATKRQNEAVSAEANAKEDQRQMSGNASDSNEGAQNKLRQVNEAGERLKASAAEFAAVKAEVETATKENIAASQKYQQSMDSGKAHTQNGKKDAFSVFGSFSSKSDSSAGTGSKTGVSLSLGKIFSTGVASQHLTEGMKSYFTAAAPASCFEKGLQLLMSLPEQDRKEGAAKIVAACSAISL